MKVQLISDTHGKHSQMIIDKSCDTIVHAGDSTNYYDLYKNEVEFKDFIKWYAALPIKNKILIAGNHDAWALKKYNKDLCKHYNINYLEDEYVQIDGKLFFGSPWSPRFGNWHFMKSRAKLGEHWGKVLSSGIDLLITHTPPKGVLDLAENFSRDIKMCGCSGLLKAVIKYEPKHHVFGHIHNNQDIINFGSRGMNLRASTKFYNASAVKDGEFSKPPVNRSGIIIEI